MRLIVKFLVGTAVTASLVWLIGYCRALSPLAWDHMREGEFDFLTFPGIRCYRMADPQTGTLGLRQIDFFSVADGPTGEMYTLSWFPCWPISFAACCVFFGGLTCLAIQTVTNSASRHSTQ